MLTGAAEVALEDFVWNNLRQLLGFTPLKRQYAVKGEVCDILALDELKQLVIIELKNPPQNSPKVSTMKVVALSRSL